MGGFFGGNLLNAQTGTYANSPTGGSNPTSATQASMAGGPATYAQRDPTRQSTTPSSPDNSNGAGPGAAGNNPTALPNNNGAGGYQPNPSPTVSPSPTNTVLPSNNRANAVINGPLNNGSNNPSSNGPLGGGLGNTVAQNNPPQSSSGTIAPTSNPGAITAGFSQSLAQNGPYAGNAQANYDYWLNNPQAANNPLASSASALSGQGQNQWTNVAHNNSNPYTGPLNFMQGQTGTGPNDANGNPIVSTYNPNLFADNSTATGIANWLGKGYSVSNGSVQNAAPGSPFSFPNANFITGPNGQQVDAGTLASYIRAFGSAPSYLNTLVQNEFSGPNLGPSTYAAQNQSNPAGQYLAYDPYSAQNAGPGNAPSANPVNVPKSAPDQTTLYNLVDGSPNLAAAVGQQQNGANGVGPGDLASFLQAYGNLASGGSGALGSSAGTPGTSGSGLDLQTILGGLLGQNYDLYQRNRNYPQQP